MIIQGLHIEKLWRVTQAVSTDPKNKHQGLSCVKVEPHGDGVIIIGTDGFVLATAFLGGVADAFETHLPTEVLKLIKLSHAEHGAYLEIIELGDTIKYNYFSNGSTTTSQDSTSRSYPSWRKVVNMVQWEGLEHRRNHGFSTRTVNLLNAILGDKYTPWQMSKALQHNETSLAVCWAECGVLAFTMPDQFSGDGDPSESRRNAAIDDARELGLI